MKISKNWLKDYVELDEANDLLVERLNFSGTEVDDVYETAEIDEKVVVAEIIKIEPHPNADRLKLATVTDGNVEQTVVCGAPNIEVGQKVPLAKIGAKMVNFEIKKAEIRGVGSNGMLCAEDELGLGDDHSGIIILDQKYELGKPLKEYINSDTVFELEITTNRGDCLSHIGMAREISVISGTKQIKKDPISLEMISEKAADHLKVSIIDKKACPQYLSRIVKNVNICPSPDWMQNRLKSCGIRPINNVVDVTNYILLDLGHPLHAFDYKKVAGKKIEVRFAKDGETIETLDGAKRTLNNKVLVIADEKKPIAIAGIMGGANSEVDENTVDIVIEAAEFDSKVIRRGKKEINLSSEASYRFERGIDSRGVEYALNKAAKLMAQLSGGKILSGIVQDGDQIIDKEVIVDYKNINKVLGLNISDQDINGILNKLGFSVNSGVATIPSWRHDIFIWQDLIEEVGRIYGYINVKPLPLEKNKSSKVTNYHKKEYLKDILVSNGSSEVQNYSFMSEYDANHSGLDTSDLLEVANPLQPENKYLRPTLLPHVLQNISRNSTFDPILVFEIGNVFSKKKESLHLVVVSAGKKSEEILQKLADSMKKDLGMTLDIQSLSADQLNKYKIRKGSLSYFEIDLSETFESIKFPTDKLALKIKNEDIVYRPVSKYPSVTRDVAFVVDNKIKAEDIESDIYSINDDIIRVELFDEFSSDKLGKNKKNLAYHLYLQKLDKTMDESEASQLMNKIVNSINKKFDAELRK